MAAEDPRHRHLHRLHATGTAHPARASFAPSCIAAARDEGKHHEQTKTHPCEFAHHRFPHSNLVEDQVRDLDQRVGAEVAEVMEGGDEEETRTLRNGERRCSHREHTSAEQSEAARYCFGM